MDMDIMPMGPGKYDTECRAALAAARADAVLLMVLNGNRGSGFSLAADLRLIGQLDVPKLLRETADQIERQFKRGAN